jgi:hypothetical protein
MLFRDFPRGGLFWSFLFIVRGKNNAEQAEHLYFCLIFYALSIAINCILRHHPVGAVDT